MDAAGFGDGIKGVQLAYSPEYQRIITEPAHAQWASAGIDLEYVHGQEPPIIDRLLAVQDWTIATLSWESPFDPDPVLRQSLEGMQNWMYGSPADGARTGRADVSQNPSDDVLVGLAETEDLLNKAAAPATQAERIPRYGTTSLLPTLISDRWPVMQRAAAAVEAALAEGVAGVRGVHFEGPYLNRDRKGVHDESVTGRRADSPSPDRHSSWTSPSSNRSPPPRAASPRPRFPPRS